MIKFNKLFETIMSDHDNGWYPQAGQSPDFYEGKSPIHDWQEPDYPPLENIEDTENIENGSPWDHETVAKFLHAPNDEYIYKAMIPITDLIPELWELQNKKSPEREDFQRTKPKGFPPIIVTRIKENQYEINDGNHRVHYWKQKGFDICPAWVNDEWLRNGGK